ncbi:MAG: ABC transporter substrate-binding protein [bacterium]|nr:ABC transporter substrate-binding protein [bacterium]
MSKNIKLGLIGIVVLVIAIVGFVVYKQKQHAELVEKIQRKTNMIVALTELPETLNPVLASSESAITVNNLIFDGLTNLSGERIDHFQYGGALELIQDAKDKKVYMVTVNTDKVWHDDPAHKLTAADVAFTFEAIINEANDSPLRGRISRLINNVEVLDDATLRINFREAIAPARVGWVLPFKLIPATYKGQPMGKNLKTDSVAQEFSKAPIGTGRWAFVSWNGNDVILRDTQIAPIDLDNATEQTLAEASQLHQITFTQVRDREKQAKLLMDGNIDLMLNSDPDLHTKLSDAGLKHADYVPHYFYALSFNTKKAPFDNANVRRGIAMSIDKAEVAGAVWSQEPEKFINKGPFPHNSERQYESFEEMNPFKPGVAKKMLKKAEGTKATLIYPEEASNMMERFSGKLVQFINEAGLQVEPKALGRAFETQLQNGNYDVALVRHSGFTQGYDISPLFFSSSPKNISGWGNAGFDKTLQKWQETAFWTEKLPLSKIIHQELSKESPYVFLFTLPTRAYFSPRLDKVLIADPSALLNTAFTWTATK